MTYPYYPGAGVDRRPEVSHIVDKNEVNVKIAIQNNLHSDEAAVHLAAQCWCDTETSGIEMDSRLACAFAKRVLRSARWRRATL